LAGANGEPPLCELDVAFGLAVGPTIPAAENLRTFLAINLQNTSFRAMSYSWTLCHARHMAKW
jgi:hypothetical protein